MRMYPYCLCGEEDVPGHKHAVGMCVDPHCWMGKTMNGWPHKTSDCQPKPELCLCEGCGRVFESYRSEDDALAEMHRNFGDIPPEDRATICDGCYQKLMALLRM